MKYDCIIMGAGLSGLTCGIKCVKEGLRTAIFSGGMNALHFSSGSIDLLGYTAKNDVVYNPFEQIQKLKKIKPDHPYSKIPVKTIKESLEFLKKELSKENLNLYNNGNSNHFRITALGLLKPTFLSQESVYNEEFGRLIEKKITISILNFEGFRDYYPKLALEHLKNNSILKNVNFTTGLIKLPAFSRQAKDLLESSSIDIARVFETEKYLPALAEEIKNAAGNAEIVSLPAFIGLTNYKKIHKRLSELTELKIFEIPTLPPSILGLRLDNALKSRFSALGGELIAGDKVTGGEIINKKLDHIHTFNYDDSRHHSKYYILSTGSFFSGGLQSGANLMEEPIFKLQIKKEKNRNKWYSKNFFDANSHPFLSYGVNTNKNLNPFDKNGEVIENLYCTGAVLSGYDPIKEGSGGGVAVSTGYYAAQKIINKIKNK